MVSKARRGQRSSASLAKQTQNIGDAPGKKEVEEKPVKVDKWDGSAVRNALDDAVKKVFAEKYHYVENHRLIDCRLALCLIAVGAAGFALLWDFLYPFPESRPVLIACVLSYFSIVGLLKLYSVFVEKSVFLVALQKDQVGLDLDNVWTVSSSLKRFDHIYHLEMQYKHGATKQTCEAKLEKSIASWFDEKGTLLYDLFEPDVCKLHDSLVGNKKEQ